jgi:hypothetical protein
MRKRRPSQKTSLLGGASPISFGIPFVPLGKREANLHRNDPAASPAIRRHYPQMSGVNADMDMERSWTYAVYKLMRSSALIALDFIAQVSSPNRFLRHHPNVRFLTVNLDFGTISIKSAGDALGGEKMTSK